MHIFDFSEQLQIFNQFSQYFDDILNTTINYKTLSDIQQGIHSYMVINDFKFGNKILIDLLHFLSIHNMIKLNKINII